MSEKKRLSFQEIEKIAINNLAAEGITSPQHIQFLEEVIESITDRIYNFSYRGTELESALSQRDRLRGELARAKSILNNNQQS